MFTLLNLNEIDDIPQAHVIINEVYHLIYITDIKYESTAKMVVGKIRIVTEDGEVVMESEDYAPTIVAIIGGKRFIVTFDGDVVSANKKAHVDSYRFDIVIDDSIIYLYPSKLKQWQAYLKSKK